MRLLFRHEAVEAQRADWLGSVRLVQPPSVAWLLVGVVAIAVALGLFLSLAQYTRKTTVAGVLVPERGLIRLVATQAGVVIDRRAIEGQAVKAGDLLFVLALERPTLETGVQAQVERSLDERRRSLQETARVRQSLAETQLLALDRRLQTLVLEQTQIDSEAAFRQQRLALAGEAQARLESLGREQFISPAQVQVKAEELLGLQAQVQALGRQRAALARERAELEGQVRSLPLAAKNAQGEVQRDLASLARELAELDAVRQVVVRAPQAGTVSAVLAESGQSVNASSALASLVPEGAALQAHLYAPSGAVGFVKPGQAVRLRFEAYPYQKFGHQEGHVLQVSRSPLSAIEMAGLSLTASDRPGEAMFRISVALDGAQAAAFPQDLVAGMRLQADVLLEKRRLVEWLFEPLLGLAGRI